MADQVPVHWNICTMAYHRSRLMLLKMGMSMPISGCLANCYLSPTYIMGWAAEKIIKGV